MTKPKGEFKKRKHVGKPKKVNKIYSDENVPSTSFDQSISDKFCDSASKKKIGDIELNYLDFTQGKSDAYDVLDFKDV